MGVEGGEMEKMEGTCAFDFLGVPTYLEPVQAK